MAAVATVGLIRARSRILIASADPSFRKRVMRNPVYAGSLSEEAVGGAHALAQLLKFPCDSVLLDRNLPDLDASEVAEQIRKQYPRTEVEMLDSRVGSETLQDGDVRETENATACDEVENLEEVSESCAKAETFAAGAEALPGMIGTSRPMQQVYRLARMVAPRDTTVLVTGETGTGKELVAEGVHRLSRRSKHPFVVVNCAAIPEALLEAELFGHARGAFTGAVQSRLGRIHVAQGGTLFLDEVGELPLSMQAKLLRFLQNGEVQRLGSSDVYRVDVRVVCATNVRLLELVQAKQFRMDLYYRLAIFPIEVPALRNRVGDVSVLADYFVTKLATETAVPPKYLTASALRFLEQGKWAGNVRELQHAIERAFILAGNDPQLSLEHFQAPGEAVS
ncbi:MAG TPA: sigma-54 dependent transcriptional regulator [Candidatus Acidoferrum sp.]